MKFAWICLGEKVNPFALGDFAEKRVLKLVKRFSGHSRAIKSYNLPQIRLQVVHFAAFWSRFKILACEVGARTESKISRLLLFAFSPPLFFRFSCPFFSLAGHLVGFILVGKVFRKALRILGLDERKGRWVMEQDFHGDFQVLVTWLFASFSGVLD